MRTLNVWKRYWILTSMLLVFAVVGTGAAALKIPRTYQAQSTVVLLASRNSSKVAGGGNPYLNFSDSLSTTASVLAEEIMNSQTTTSLEARGFSERYQVTSQSTLSQTTTLPTPFLITTVTGKDSLLVEHTLRGVTDEIGVLLNELQNGIAPNNRILLITASYAPQATISTTSTLRPLIAILGVLVILALAVPLVVDAQLVRRTMRRSVNQAPSSTPKRLEEGSYVRNGHRQPRSVTLERQREVPRVHEQEREVYVRRSSERDS